MKRLILLASLILWTACGGGGSGVGDVGNIPVPQGGAVPDGVADGAENVALGNLFDVWTLTGSLSETDCPNVELPAPIITEEVRIIETEEGCLLEDKLADGTVLSNQGALYEVEDTRCHVRGNQLDLQFSFDFSQFVNEGCVFLLDGNSNLEWVEGDQLKGLYRLEGTFEGDCGVLVNSCFLTASIVGVRGRHAPQEGEDEEANPINDPVIDPRVVPGVEPEGGVE